MASKCSSQSSVPSRKRKMNILSLNTKLEIIEEHEHGKSRAALMEKYGLKKTSIHNILKAKEKTRKSVKMLECRHKGVELFRSKKLSMEGLDEAVFQWYKQQRAEGMPTKGLDIQQAAEKLATGLGYGNFKCSNGWLWRFRRRHGIVNKVVTREMQNANPKVVNRFTTGLKPVVEDKVLFQNDECHFQISFLYEQGKVCANILFDIL